MGSFSSPSSLSSRSKQQQQKQRRRIDRLMEWAKSDAVGIQVSGTIRLTESPDSGIGWNMAGTSAQPGSLLMTVPSAVALTVECPGAGPNDTSVKVDTNWPWFVQMAVYLYTLQQRAGSGSDDNNEQKKKKARLDYGSWLEALPPSFDTPIHWPSSAIAELQYPPLVRAVERQRVQWDSFYNNAELKKLYPQLSLDEFIYWCEISRSRAFSGGFGGTAFSPNLYAFTLLLVTAYVGLNLGTLEQAANGAGVVLAVSILKGQCGELFFGFVFFFLVVT
jgi:hypothetical protein